jgi:hypothetical protein
LSDEFAWRHEIQRDKITLDEKEGKKGRERERERQTERDTFGKRKTTCS